MSGSQGLMGTTCHGVDKRLGKEVGGFAVKPRQLLGLVICAKAGSRLAMAYQDRAGA